MRFFAPAFCLFLVTCLALITPANGQIGKHHDSVESLVAKADFVAIGRLVSVRSEVSPTGNGSTRLVIKPSFSEILKGKGSEDKLDALEVDFHSSDFYQRFVTNQTSGVWFITFSKDGKVSGKPLYWNFWAFEELGGFKHPLFAPPMLSNDLSVLTTQDAILKKLRESCDNGTPKTVGINVPHWLVSPVGAADANSMSFAIDEVCEKTAEQLVTNPSRFLRLRNLENDELKLCQLESLGLELLQHFPSKENEVLVRTLLKTPVRPSATRARRISAYEILLRWGAAVERPSFWETITELDLANSKATDDTMALLGKLGNLKQLNLKNTQVTKAGLSLLGPLQHLLLLELDSQQVTDDNLKVLGEIGLIEAISVVGWKYVQDAEPRTTSISSLNLKDCQLTDIGLSQFSHLESVGYADLRATLVSDKGLDSLSRMSDLEALFIDDTKITDLGVKKVLQFKKLKTLSLSNPEISDQTLTDLASLPHLRYLFLKGPKVTPEAVARFRNALPDCKINSW